MKIVDFLKKEFSGWTNFEKLLIPIILVLVVGLSIYANDSIIVTIHAFFGIMATITAGKGKISCYFLGIIGAICYSYISLKNALWGTFLLQTFYYLPMDFIGIFAWKKHLKEESKEVIKTKLSVLNRWIYSLVTIFFTIILGFILMFYNDKFPFLDSIATVFPILAFYLVVKRCFEQWIIWSIVNAVNIIIWLKIYSQGGNTFATLLTWLIYFAFGIYFLYQWIQEIKTEEKNKADYN